MMADDRSLLQKPLGGIDGENDDKAVEFRRVDYPRQSC